MTELAAIQHLQVSFQTEEKGYLSAVDDLSFTLKAGETLALLGESGCGKSLTSLALMRLLPNNAAYGLASKIKLDESDLLDLPEALMRQLRGKRIAIIFQEPMTALNPVLTIGDQMAEALHAKTRLSKAAIKKELITLLTDVEIPQPEIRLKQYPHQLSGGQKQRIVIAMAIANNPEILIADEPTTALDVTIQAQILVLLKKLQQQYKMSMLLITHDLGVVKAVADRVCVMYAGQLVEEARVEQFFKDLKHPYSKQLLAALPSYNKRELRLAAIPGAVPVLGDWPAGCRFHPRCAYRFEPCPTVMPVLQRKEDRAIRCHLYPEQQSLPPLNEVSTNWPLIAASSECLLTVKDLKVDFVLGQGWLSKNKQVIKAVDGLSLQLFQGKTLALVGESGCGKTTVSRSLLQLLPITSGEIRFRGQDLKHLKGEALRKYRNRVQIIFQDPYSSMNPRMTVGEIIAEGMVAQGMKSSAIAHKQVQLLEQVNLPKTALHRYPHQFSGGQRQRIGIARALAVDPEILICDEPTSALDVSVQAQILNLLKALQLEHGIAYLFITHNMAVVSYLADEIIVMKEGKMVEKGSCSQIFNEPKEDYTRQLLASVLAVDCR